MVWDFRRALSPYCPKGLRGIARWPARADARAGHTCSSSVPLRFHPGFDLALGLALAKSVARLQALDQFVAAAADMGDIFVSKLDPVAADAGLELHPIALDVGPVHRCLRIGDGQ